MTTFPSILAESILEGSNLTTIIVAVVAGGSLTACVSWFLARKKTHAETEGIVADTYSQVLADMRTELTRYQTMLEAANRRISKLEVDRNRTTVRVRQLERAMLEADIPIPPDVYSTPPYGQSGLWDQPREEGESKA